MILCHCAVVSDREIVAAVRDGARSAGEVMRRTGAGQGCGGCVLAVRAAVRDSLAEAREDDPDERQVVHAAG